MVEQEDRLLSINEVAERINFSVSWIYDRLDKKSPRHDPTFPPQLKIGVASRWRASDIEKWLNAVCIADDDPTEKAPLVDKRDTGQSAVQSRSENNRAQSDDLDEKRVATIRRLLEENARKGALVRYSELMAATMLSPDSQKDWQKIDDIVARISKSSHLENNVLLGAHVREYRGSGGVPRQAFFELARSLGYQCNDREAFVRTQLLALFAHYDNPKYKTAKNLRWVEVRGKCFLMCPS